MFLRKTALSREPLPMTMSGVRMGERALQIGIDDPVLAGALAAKVGLSGQATIAVPSEAAAERARQGAAEAGVLLDVHVTPLDALPVPSEAFDVVVIHSLTGLIAALEERARDGLFDECHRVLRQGGRLVSIEQAPRRGLTALLRQGARPNPAYDAAGGAAAALQRAGFKPVRVLAERDGYRFTEGLKGA